MVFFVVLGISFARVSSSGGLVGVLLYMLCSLSSLLFSIVHRGVRFGLCGVVCVDFVGCCVSSYRLFAWVSRSRLMVVIVENETLTDLHPLL